MTIFDTNSYFVLDYLVRKSLLIHYTPDAVMICDDAKQVVSHSRSFHKRHQTVNSLHRGYGKLSVKAKMQRIYYQKPASRDIRLPGLEPGIWTGFPKGSL